MVRQRGDALLRPGTRRSSRPTPGTGSRRCRRRRRARCAAGRAAAARGSSLATMRYWMLGRSKLGDEVPRVGQRQVACAISRAGRRGRGGGQRDPRDRRASARAASTARGSRAGSRGPTGTRSAPRRWRTGRSVPRSSSRVGRARCAAAPAPGRAGRARRRRTRPRPRGGSSASWVELRKPARTPSAASASTWSCISAISGEITTPVPGADQRRDLVAQRLAAAGRHQHQGVAAGDDVVDDRLLVAAERVVAEDALEHLERVGRRREPGNGHRQQSRRQPRSRTRDAVMARLTRGQRSGDRPGHLRHQGDRGRPATARCSRVAEQPVHPAYLDGGGVEQDPQALLDSVLVAGRRAAEAPASRSTPSRWPTRARRCWPGTGRPGARSARRWCGRTAAPSRCAPSGGSTPTASQR